MSILVMHMTMWRCGGEDECGEANRVGRASSGEADSREHTLAAPSPVW